MIEINLLPEEERKRKKELSMPSLSLKLPGNMMFFGGIGVVLVVLIIVIIIHFSQVNTIKRYNVKIDELRTELKKLKEEQKKVENMKKKEAEINQKLNTIKNLAKEKFVYPKFFDALNKNIPDYLWLENLSINNTSLEIKGKTFSNLKITDFLENLKTMNDFIDKNSIVLKDMVNNETEGHDIISFAISCKFLK